MFFFSSRRRHTRCALVTGVQTCALPIYWTVPREAVARRRLRGLLRDHARLPAVRHLRPRGRAVHSVAVMSLLHLSLRRVGNHTHAVPQPPTNAERLAAYRAPVPPPACNHHPWPHLRSDERRVGKEWVSTVKSRWSPVNKK